MKKSRKTKSRTIAVREVDKVAAPADRLFADLRELIEAARQQIAQIVNAGLVTLYWLIGKRIREEVLGEKRATYGERILSTLSKKLTAEYGRGFSEPNLSRMMRFAEVFPDERILSALSKELSWSHFVEINAIDDPLKREFYAEGRAGWSGGAHGRCKTRSSGWSTSARPSARSQNNSFAPSSTRCATKIA